MKQMLPLKNAEPGMVEFRNGTYYCKTHGAMNKLTSTGIWRCVAAYERIDNGTPQGRLIENICKAGFQEGEEYPAMDYRGICSRCGHRHYSGISPGCTVCDCLWSLDRVGRGWEEIQNGEVDGPA